jgi:hypothetical protein
MPLEYLGIFAIAVFAISRVEGFVFFLLHTMQVTTSMKIAIPAITAPAATNPIIKGSFDGNGGGGGGGGGSEGAHAELFGSVHRNGLPSNLCSHFGT